MPKVKELRQNIEDNVVVTGTHKVFQAGLGAVMLAQGEVRQLAHKFIEEGETAEKENRQRINDLMERRRKEAQKATKRVEKEFEKRMETILHTMNIPTKSDIRALNNKIGRLSKKIEELDGVSVPG